MKPCKNLKDRPISNYPSPFYKIKAFDFSQTLFAITSEPIMQGLKALRIIGRNQSNIKTGLQYKLWILFNIYEIVKSLTSNQLYIFYANVLMSHFILECVSHKLQCLKIYAKCGKIFQEYMRKRKHLIKLIISNQLGLLAIQIFCWRGLSQHFFNHDFSNALYMEKQTCFSPEM